MRTGRLILRNWEERDRELFFRINSDDRVMQFFPFRRDRAQSDAFFDRLRADVAARGYGFAAVERADDGASMGFCGLHPTAMEPVLPFGTIEIGWRLAPEFWGQGYVTEAARAWLEFGFRTLSLDEVVSFAVWNNARSTRVMERLGMQRQPHRDFDHPAIPQTRPDLRRHVFYALSRQE